MKIYMNPIKIFKHLNLFIAQTLNHCIQLEQEYGRFFLFIPVFLAFGAIFWFTNATETSASTILLIIIITTIISLKIQSSHPIIALIISAITCFAIGMMLAMIETTRNSTIILPDSMTTNIRGIVKWGEPLKDGKWRYLVQVIESHHHYSDLFSQKVMLSVTKKHEHFVPGEIIEGIARLSPPSGPALPKLFDSRFFSYYKGISASGFFYSIPRSYPMYADNNWKQPLSKIQFWLNEIRTNIGTHIRSHIPEDTGALAAALITDERRAISTETTEYLRKSGLAHIIAISGINMTIAAGLCLFGMRSIFSAFPVFAERFSIKKISALGSLLTVTAYFLISGASIPAQRAYFMTVIILFSYLIDKQIMGLRSIALTVIIIICISPSEVMNPSFQMSFAATAALIASNSILQKRPKPHPLLAMLPDKGIILTVIIRFCRIVFLTSLIGGASSALFLIKHFHCIPIYGLIANILAIPILSFVVMPAGLIAMLLMMCSLDEIPLHIMGWGLEIIINIAHKISTIGNEFCIGRMSHTLFIIAVIGFLLLIIFKTAMRHIGTAIIVCVIATFFLPSSSLSPSLLISEDGKLAAFLDHNTLSSNYLNPPYFTFSQWKSSFMAPVHNEPQIQRVNLQNLNQEILKEMLKSLKSGKFLCINKSFCVGHQNNSVVVSVLRKKESMPLMCQLSDILITTIKDITPELCHVPLLIDPEMLKQKGSLEIRIVPPSNKHERVSFIVNHSREGLSSPWHRSSNQNKVILE
ncbi:MAG: ComEC family competence protein [Candidatus Liberibacter ctenarytainae]|uniref:ComEC family competence protein n=1 Tax=Candidatus Liberibacter ctenarytainae TaxID=2020335 RepID=A0A937DIP7_9HYPH|nr:ComEC family competence protein [Candidatus Liberibacter ctenarytainae]